MYSRNMNRLNSRASRGAGAARISLARIPSGPGAESFSVVDWAIITSLVVIGSQNSWMRFVVVIGRLSIILGAEKIGAQKASCFSSSTLGGDFRRRGRSR